MASAPQQPQLPMFYNDLMPLNTRDHMKFRNRQSDSAPWLSKQHVVPITADEFIQAGRHYPVVFSQGSNPLPLALMGLNEGVNTFFDDDGKLIDPVYVPAYIRRYPFILARLNDQGDNLSLCFDPTSDSVGEYDEGELLFNEDGSTTDQTKSILDFCEKFEQAGQRTKMLTDEGIDPDPFDLDAMLGSPRPVMRMTIDSLRDRWGGMEGYADFLGLDAGRRAAARANLRFAQP